MKSSSPKTEPTAPLSVDFPRREAPIRVLDIRSIDGAGGGADKILLRTATAGVELQLHSIICAIHSPRDHAFDLVERGKRCSATVLPVAQRWPFDPAVYRSLSSILSANHFDVLHSHDYKASYYAARLSRQFALPRVSTSHGWTGNMWRERFLYYPLDKRLLRDFDANIAVSSDIHKELLSSGVPADRIHTVLNGVDHRAYKPDEKTRTATRNKLGIEDHHYVLGSVGRVEKQKRFDLLLQAFAELIPQHPHLRLVIAGTGSLLASLRNQAVNLGIDHQCLILGHHQDMRSLYQAFDLYVQSSEYEGTPTVLVEAMAMHVPIVATDVGGTAELVTPNVDALLIPPHDVPGLMSAIKQSLDCPAETLTRVVHARSRVESSLSIQARTRRLVDIYKHVLER